MFLCVFMGLMSLSSISSPEIYLSNPQDNVEAVLTTGDDVADDVKESKKEKSTDWFTLIIAIGYLLGVFVLLPLVIYTNLNENIFVPTGNNEDKILVLEGLNDIDRNDKAMEVLQSIESKMSSISDEEGTEFITITNASQARYTKMGLDYILTRLNPNDEAVKARVAELTDVYTKRTKRVYTGSNWILGCAVGMIVFFGFIDSSMLLSSFMFLHVLGIVFYYLSSRTPLYALEKRIDYLSSGKLGFVASIFSGLFVGLAAKQYVKTNGGPWLRDSGAELTSSGIILIIMFVVALFISFMVALFGILNFAANYSKSFITPFNKVDKWYEETYRPAA